MDANVIAAVFGAVGGVVTGTISSLIAPWVQWGIEKRRKRFERRRSLINSWRDMVARVRKRCEEEVENDRAKKPDPGDVLLEQPEYASLRPHLSQKTLRLLFHKSQAV